MAGGERAKGRRAGVPPLPPLFRLRRAAQESGEGKRAWLANRVIAQRQSERPADMETGNPEILGLLLNFLGNLDMMVSCRHWSETTASGCDQLHPKSLPSCNLQGLDALFGIGH